MRMQSAIAYRGMSLLSIFYALKADLQSKIKIKIKRCLVGKQKQILGAGLNSVRLAVLIEGRDIKALKVGMVLTSCLPTNCWPS